MDLKEQIKEVIESRGFDRMSIDLKVERIYALMNIKSVNENHNRKDVWGNRYAKLNVSEEDIDEVYKAYPTKCVVRGTSTGKSHKDKIKVKWMLSRYPKIEIIETIKRYTLECFKYGTYMKNFRTFLECMPDYSNESKDESHWWLKDDGYSKGTKHE